MLVVDSLLPNLNRVTKAAFYAELRLRNNMGSNPGWAGNSLTLAYSLNAASSLVDDYLSSIHNNYPDGVLFTIVETISRYINDFIKGLSLPVSARNAAINKSREMVFSDIKRALACLAMNDKNNNIASLFLLSVSDATTREIMLCFTGHLVWDLDAWEYCQPSAKNLH